MADTQPLLLAGHPAIDFLNTTFAPKGELVETLGDGRALLQWLVAAGLLDAADSPRLHRRLGNKAMDAAAAEARRLREWARAWIERWRIAPGRDYRQEFTRLNELMEEAPYTRELATNGRHAELRERARNGSPQALLGLIATQLAKLVTEEDASLIKSCAGAGCTLWFLDRTKAHRRLFCSTSVCGNRAKVAAYRARQRT
jgi:predicted RNA-binding Zn ribbon-like protein